MSTGATANLKVWFVDATIVFGVAPVLLSIDPATGPEAGGTFVTLTGTDFTADTTVTFDGLAATSIVFVNDTTITCVTPAHAFGLVDVVVTNGDGSDTLTDGFLYVAIGEGFPPTGANGLEVTGTASSLETGDASTLETAGANSLAVTAGASVLEVAGTASTLEVDGMAVTDFQEKRDDTNTRDFTLKNPNGSRFDPTPNGGLAGLSFLFELESTTPPGSALGTGVGIFADVDVVNGVVSYTFAAADTATAGVFRMEIESLGAQRRTFPGDGYLTFEIVADLGDG